MKSCPKFAEVMMCKIRQILIITEIILKVEIYIKIITITNNNNLITIIITNNNNEQFIEYFDFYKLRVYIWFSFSIVMNNARSWETQACREFL